MTDDQPTHSRGDAVRASARTAARRVRLTIGAVLIVLLTLLVVVNTDNVRVNLLFTHVTLPLIVLLVVVAVVGALIGALLTLAARRSRHSREG